MGVLIRALVLAFALLGPTAEARAGEAAVGPAGEDERLVTARYVVAVVDEDRRQVVLRRIGLTPGAQSELPTGRELTISFDDLRDLLGTAAGLSEGDELTVVLDSDTTDIERIER